VDEYVSLLGIVWDYVFCYRVERKRGCWTE
jgi:hypothetical protein